MVDELKTNDLLFKAFLNNLNATHHVFNYLNTGGWSES